MRHLILALSFVSSISPAATQPGKKLAECYQAALRRSEVIANSEQTIRQAEELFNQSVGLVLPTISGVASYQWQEPPSSAVGAQVSPSAQPLVKLTAIQPLFQGFKEFAAMNQGRGLIAASTQDKRQAQTALYYDTANSYYAVLTYERDLDNVTAQLALYDKRIAELKEFENIGKSRSTEVLTAQAQRLTLMATSEQIKGLLRATREALAFVTGFENDVVLVDTFAEPPQAKELKTYTDRINQRPDVQAEMARSRAADSAITVARSAHYPTLAAQGDWFFVRAGSLKDVHWDAILALSVPIFNGGVINSQVSQAISKRDQAESTLSRAKRLALQQIRTLHSNYQFDRNQWETYKEARQVAEQNFKQQTRDYKRGLVTNLDVLTSMTSFQETQRARDRTRYAMENDFENLEAASVLRAPESP
jgi:outer membrane protein